MPGWLLLLFLAFPISSMLCMVLCIRKTPNAAPWDDEAQEHTA